MDSKQLIEAAVHTDVRKLVSYYDSQTVPIAKTIVEADWSKEANNLYTHFNARIVPMAKHAASKLDSEAHKYRTEVDAAFRDLWTKLTSELEREAKKLGVSDEEEADLEDSLLGDINLHLGKELEAVFQEIADQIKHRSGSDWLEKKWR